MKRVYSRFVSGDLFESDRTMVDRYKRDLRRQRHDFAHLHFSACDWIGHQFGPDSPQMEEAIQTVDSWVKEIHEQALGSYGDVRILATADHGMVKVGEHYDIGQELLASLPFSEPDDYLCFRDSTMARFWFFKPRAEDEIRKRLEKVSWGRIVDEEMRKKHHIRFADNSNGDLIFLLEPGAVLLPNYYQAAGTPPKGMHGYAPDVSDNQGAIVIHDPHRSFAASQGATLDLVDVFRTLVDMHGLPLPDKSMRSSVLTQ
jgi:predicted AlkP superfamily pyrophosphatase or phosphodiesterase